MKILTYLSKNFQTILIIGLVAVVILLFIKPCNSGDEKLKALQAENKRIEQKHKEDSISFARERARWQDSIHNAAVNSDLQVKVIKETEKKLQASQSRVNQLTAIIRNSPGPDSLNGVLVSKEYKEACDSLPNEIDKQNVVIADLKENNEGLIDLMSYEVTYRDSLIEAEQKQNTRLNDLYNRSSKVAEDALAKARPRGRLLGGVGLIGNEVNFLSGTKINLAYQHKNGKQFQVGGLLLKGAVYYEATVLITLIK